MERNSTTMRKRRLRGKAPPVSVTVETDYLGRLLINIPRSFQFVKGERFLVKVVGKEIVLLSTRHPIRLQTIKRLNVRRWRLASASKARPRL